MDDDTIQHEVFASFAEHLVPEAFATPTRAYRVTCETPGPAPADRAQARARFDRWTAARPSHGGDAGVPPHAPPTPGTSPPPLAAAPFPKALARLREDLQVLL